MYHNNWYNIIKKEVTIMILSTVIIINILILLLVIIITAKESHNGLALCISYGDAQEKSKINFEL